MGGAQSEQAGYNISETALVLCAEESAHSTNMATRFGAPHPAPLIRCRPEFLWLRSNLMHYAKLSWSLFLFAALAALFAGGTAAASDPGDSEVLRQRIAELETALAEKETALAEAKERADAATKESEAHDMDKAALETRVAELEEQITASQGEAISADESEMAALQQELEELRTLCARLQDENEILRERAGLARGSQATSSESPDTTPTPRPAEKVAAIPVPGKEGFFTSPHAPDEGMIDLRGFSSGTEVKDPYTGRPIYVP
jgi:uncharacterized coiled-coil protein SlyX